jgi:quercetin dioxygenase-like cupin family protein
VKPDKNIIFPMGDKLPNDHFTGSAWLKMLVPDDQTYNCPIGNVTFAPKARNNWHRHSGGQILLVTAGAGYYQEKGRPARLLREGDVVTIPPDVEHWHGATAESWFAHLAITANARSNSVTWLAPVTDEQYGSLKIQS